MHNRYFLLPVLFLAVLLNSCEIAANPQTAGTNPAHTPAQLNATPPPPASGLPTPFSVPASWSALQLSGKLIFVVSTSDGYYNYMDVQTLDLRTGGITTIFQSVPDGYIDGAVVSPDHKQIVMAYAPPVLKQGAFFYPTALFSMPVDGSQPPKKIISPPVKDDQYIEPAWSPDGRTLYFVLVKTGEPLAEPSQQYPIEQIFRMAYPDGQPEMILDKAYWPRVSADGSQLVYVTENPDDGTNKLYIANNDGSNPRQIMLSGTNVPEIIDAPIFFPDGKTILFSAPTPGQSSTAPWLAWLFGAIPASAHDLESDWWSVPVGGGTITQLTHIQTPGLYGSFSPDNRMIVSCSTNRIYVMDPDGANLTMLLSDTGGSMGTVDWIP